MPRERRRQRSNDPTTALGLFLEAEARRRGARAMAIGTLDGLPLAGVGDHDPLELAAVGSLFAGGQAAAVQGMIDDFDAVLVAIDGGSVVLSCCGVKAPPAGALDGHVGRILG